MVVTPVDARFMKTAMIKTTTPVLVGMLSTIVITLAFLHVPQAFASSKIEKAPGFIYIASFNVFRLGAIENRYDTVSELNDQIPTRIKNIARVLAVGDFDIIVLQEVRTGQSGQAVMSDLVRVLKDNHGLTYQSILSEAIGRGYKMTEAMAFLYQPNSVQPETVKDTDSLSANIDIPGRDLVRTQWEAGFFDFTLISAHLAWGNHDDRRAGYKKIAEIFDNPTDWSRDPDIIVLGDFNRFGDGAEAVRALPYDANKFRAPHVTFFDPSFSTLEEVKKSVIEGKGIPDNDPQLLSTTVANNKSVYDIIMFSSDASEEFPTELGHARYGTDFGIIHFDQPNGFGYQPGADKMAHDKLKEAYSDHRPIWIRFRVDDPSVADD